MHTIQSILAAMNGDYTMDIKIFDVWGDDKVLSRYGNPYLVIYVEYFNLKNPKILYKKTLPAFNVEEAELLIFGLEVEHEYRITVSKQNSKYWQWINAQELGE